VTLVSMQWWREALAISRQTTIPQSRPHEILHFFEGQFYATHLQPASIVRLFIC
jgi:hypothetical protein